MVTTLANQEPLLKQNTTARLLNMAGPNTLEPHRSLTNTMFSNCFKLCECTFSRFLFICVIYLHSTSFSQLDSSNWNIDMQELEYNPSKKDLTDARIHHLLAEELCKPYRRVSDFFLAHSETSF